MSDQENMANAADSQSGDGSITGSIADFPEFDESTKKGFAGDDKLEFLKDLQLNIYIELGRTKMQIQDILELERGYVIELEKLASEPVDVFVNNKKIAEGEVVVIDKHFGIRITNLIDTSERLKGIA
ncbi:MAG: flagellar motor switch protein FliN [Ignavibacteria bacterium]|jgi:flagellar motor switch protein FliN/FliY